MFLLLMIILDNFINTTKLPDIRSSTKSKISDLRRFYNKKSKLIVVDAFNIYGNSFLQKLRILHGKIPKYRKDKMNRSLMGKIECMRKKSIRMSQKILIFMSDVHYKFSTNLDYLQFTCIENKYNMNLHTLNNQIYNFERLISNDENQIYIIKYQNIKSKDILDEYLNIIETFIKNVIDQFEEYLKFASLFYIIGKTIECSIEEERSEKMRIFNVTRNVSFETLIELKEKIFILIKNYKEQKNTLIFYEIDEFIITKDDDYLNHLVFRYCFKLLQLRLFFINTGYKFCLGLDAKQNLFYSKNIVSGKMFFKIFNKANDMTIYKHFIDNIFKEMETFESEVLKKSLQYGNNVFRSLENLEGHIFELKKGKGIKEECASDPSQAAELNHKEILKFSKIYNNLNKAANISENLFQSQILECFRVNFDDLRVVIKESLRIGNDALDLLIDDLLNSTENKASVVKCSATILDYYDVLFNKKVKCLSAN
ncbi:hypothetical protein H312_00198 [Anncaliia algerae PRA339]|uniref:Uncharacterized protein n=1 Tax=Anncaliia algerae PRA339 TaxID=1288291 RepID=A0A059F5T3_9MICR|nr:hypothetical protein H312_00198 [Anncaliia algerae PRA339]